MVRTKTEWRHTQMEVWRINEVLKRDNRICKWKSTGEGANRRIYNQAAGEMIGRIKKRSKNGWYGEGCKVTLERKARIEYVRTCLYEYKQEHEINRSYDKY